MHRHRNQLPAVAALRLIGLDRRFDRRQLDELAAHTDVVRLPAGEVVVRSGAVARQFVAVVDGCVDVTEQGGRTRVADAGAEFGEVELTTGRPHTTTATTRSETTVVMIFGPAFRGVAHATPALADRRANRRRLAIAVDASVLNRPPAFAD